MNSLKTLFVSAVLVSVLYGVYWAMNQHSAPAPPLDIAPAWDGRSGGDLAAVGAPSVDAGRQIQLRAPAVTMAENTSGSGVKTLVPPPKVTMDFDMPDAASRPVAAKAQLPRGVGAPDVPAASTASAVTRQIAPLEIAPQRPASGSGTVAQKTFPSSQQTFPSTAGPRGEEPLQPSSPQGFDALMAVVRGELDRGRLLKAYRTLSRRYPDPRFTTEQSRRVEYLLDRLAGTIVYSRHHFLEKPYCVGENETLEQIARRYNVPPELLTKINRLAPSQQPAVGSRLKVVRGPLTAHVDLDKHQLTLRLPDGGYAGRFHIGVGRDVPGINKDYHVFDKIASPPRGEVTQAGYAPAATGQQKWIGLEGRLGIHAADRAADIGSSGSRGGIVLSGRDVDDLYDILSVGSRVAIRR